MDMEDIIIEFWLCSLKSDFSDFDWDQAFNTYEPYLAENCIGHGQGTFEEFKNLYDDIYGLDNMECDIPSWAVYCTDWGWFSDIEACEVLLKAKYEFMKNTFESNIHGYNAKLLERIRNRKNLPEPELISLFDECIHAQHATGSILEDCDVEQLREEAEKKHKENQSRFPTNIRDFLVNWGV